MRRLEVSERITQRRTESIKQYFNDVSQIPLLEAQEEYELAVKSFKGNEIARQKLIKHNLRFVISVAKQYETDEISLEDLINEGNLGLITAAEKFDPSRGFKFISYAVWWIRRNIIAFITDNSKIIRLPSNKSSANYKIKQKCIELEQKLNYYPSYNEFMTNYEEEFSEDDVLFFFSNLDNKTASLDVNTGSQSDNAQNTLLNVLESDNVMKTNHYTNENDEIIKRERFLNLLKKANEREVIKLLFGMDGKEPLSLKTTGFVMGLSSERVRQIRDSALDNLKTSLTK